MGKQQKKQRKVIKALTPPRVENLSPTLMQLRGIVETQPTPLYRISVEAGFSNNMLTLWLHGEYDPTLTNLEVMLHKMGYRLQIVKHESGDPVPVRRSDST